MAPATAHELYAAFRSVCSVDDEGELLLPLGFLAGHEVFRHSKPLWAGTFIVVAILFALIVLPTAAGETAAVEDMAFWMLVMAIFAAVTLTLWALLQFTGNGSRDGDEEGVEDGAEEEAATASAR